MMASLLPSISAFSHSTLFFPALVSMLTVELLVFRRLHGSEVICVVVFMVLNLFRKGEKKENL